MRASARVSPARAGIRAQARDAVEGGVRATVMRALGLTLYRRLAWMELRLDVRPDGPAALVPLETAFLGEDDVAEVAALRPDIGAAGALVRLRRGDRCHGARHAGRLVSLSWISTGVARIDYLGLAVRLGPGVAYHYDRWTDPRLRGLRIAGGVGVALCEALVEEGIRVVAAAIHPENTPGIVNARRVGYEVVGTIGWVGVGRLRRPFRTYRDDLATGRGRRFSRHTE